MRSWALGAFLAACLAAPASAAPGGPVKHAFGAVALPAPGAPAVHGGAAAGCVAGAVALPDSGPGWQAVRLSRNRFWTHPETAAFITRLGAAALGLGWPGLLVGDLSQPRGGPMTSGHRSHQTGLDADIWLRRPERPDHSRAEREGMSSTSMVAPNRIDVSADWTPGHGALIRAAAEDPGVDRIFVNAAIKAELCRTAPRQGRDWLRKVRPWWSHDSHMHVRMACPAADPGCEAQSPLPAGDGCDASLDWWFSDEALNPPPPRVPPAPPKELTLSDLPAACAAVLAAP